MPFIQGLPSSPCTQKKCGFDNNHVMELISVPESSLFHTAYSHMKSNLNKEEILFVGFSDKQPQPITSELPTKPIKRKSDVSPKMSKKERKLLPSSGKSELTTEQPTLSKRKSEVPLEPPQSSKKQCDLLSQQPKPVVYYSQVTDRKKAWEFIKICDEKKDKDKNNVIVLGNRQDKKGQEGLGDDAGYVYILVTTWDIYEDYYQSHKPSQCQSLWPTYTSSIDQSLKLLVNKMKMKGLLP